MLLAQYLSDRHLYRLGKPASSLQGIKRFELGDRYRVRMHVGVTYDIPDLEDVLSIISEEFRVARRRPLVGFSENTWSPSLVPVARQLEVSASILPAVREAYQLDYEVELVVAKIRDAVTMYNLTQSWDQFNKGNL